MTHEPGEGPRNPSESRKRTIVGRADDDKRDKAAEADLEDPEKHGDNE